ncbi:MAG: S8 family serine peptidase, partial [Flavobacteriales bacterium]|nr:S8 family serine peptidase [Flavobacteriales bacterium]
MRYLIATLLLLPFALIAQNDIKEHLNFQTKWMVSQKSDQDQVSIFIRGDVNQINKYLNVIGRKSKAQLGNLVLVNLTIGDVKFLAKQDYVEGFEWEWGRNTLMSDSMLLKNNVLNVHAGTSPLIQPFTGKGVISGVIDTGIDPLHRDFQNADSSTRILAIWDQTLPFDASLTPSFGYGQVFDSSLINAGPIAHFDGDTHGTGVAGVMAGNGQHSGALAGVAIESDIVAVELDFSGANTTASVDAFKYIYDVADSYGMPCVINASYGDYLGSHDGKDATSLFLDSLMNEQAGRLFVAAAGNSGDWGPYHLKHIVTGPADTSFTWFVPNTNSSSGNSVFLDIWADTADLNNLNFSIGADHNTTFAHADHLNFRNIIADGLVGTTIVDSLMNGGKMAEVLIYTELRGGQYNLQIFIPSVDSMDYNYSIISTGTGTMDLWSSIYLGVVIGPDVVWLSQIVKDGLPGSGTWPSMSVYHLPDSNQSMVSGFQCLANVATVGQYVNRSEYTDFLSAVQVCPQLTDSIAMNSSAGPTRLGLMKPDVNSTGFWVMSALPVSTAITMQGSGSAWRLIQSGFHTRRAGTSFSSPAVAGIGALLLEKCPNLTASEFINLLHTTSFADAYTGTLPNNRWGYGKTDAFAMLNATNVNPNVVGDTVFCFGKTTSLSTDSTYALYNW